MTTTTTENLAAPSGTFRLGGDLPVVRLGYGTMQLPGEGVWGPPRDRDAAIASSWSFGGPQTPSPVSCIVP